MKKVEHIATEAWVKEMEKEWALMEKSGVEIVNLSPADAKKLQEIVDTETWKVVLKGAPELGSEFRKLTSPCKK